MSDLAGLIQKARDRKKSRYTLAKTLGYTGTEAGFMQSWSVARIRLQAVEDGKTRWPQALPMDVTNEGIDSGK